MGPGDMFTMYWDAFLDPVRENKNCGPLIVQFTQVGDQSAQYFKLSLQLGKPLIMNQQCRKHRPHRGVCNV